MTGVGGTVGGLGSQIEPSSRTVCQFRNLYFTMRKTKDFWFFWSGIDSRLFWTRVRYSKSRLCYFTWLQLQQMNDVWMKLVFPGPESVILFLCCGKRSRTYQQVLHRRRNRSAPQVKKWTLRSYIAAAD